MNQFSNEPTHTDCNSEFGFSTFLWFWRTALDLFSHVENFFPSAKMKQKSLAFWSFQSWKGLLWRLGLKKKIRRRRRTASFLRGSPTKCWWVSVSLNLCPVGLQPISFWKSALLTEKIPFFQQINDFFYDFLNNFVKQKIDPNVLYPNKNGDPWHPWLKNKETNTDSTSPGECNSM